jgi:acyl-CoA reductase-like NAD-dependent aldehyde dehydrogenase
MRVFKEETFGPLAPITPFRDTAEMFELANRGTFGLVGAVFTRDLGRAFRIAEGVRCGVFNVNESTNYWELHVPYGGVRGSGSGRIGGQHSLWEMTDLKTVIIDVPNMN